MMSLYHVYHSYTVQFLKRGKVVSTTVVSAFTEIGAKITAVRLLNLLPADWDEAEATSL